MLHERDWLERARKKVQKCLLWPKDFSKMESLGPTYQPPWVGGILQAASPTPQGHPQGPLLSSLL